MPTINNNNQNLNMDISNVGDNVKSNKNSKLRSTEVKKRIVATEKDYTQNKAIRKMSLSKVIPKITNLIAKTKKSFNNEDKLNNKMFIVSNLQGFYSKFDHINNNTSKLLNEANQLKQQLVEVNQTTKNFEKKYAKELKFISGYKTGDDLSGISHKVLCAPPDDMKFVISKKSSTLEKNSAADKFIEQFTKTEEFKQYNEYKTLKSNFKAGFNDLLKHHNTQIQIQKAEINKIPKTIKQLDRQINKLYTKTNSTESSLDIHNKSEEKTRLKTEYAHYKNMENVLKNSNASKKDLFSDIKKLDKEINKKEHQQIKDHSYYNTQENTSDYNKKLDAFVADRNSLGNIIEDMKKFNI